MNKIQQINKTIGDYFEQNPGINVIAAKDMMPYFVLRGIFGKDIKKGQPIRAFLRELDQENTLNKIPYAYPKRKAAYVNWFFTRAAGFDLISETGASHTIKIQSHTAHYRKGSDECYVLDLCDAVLKRKGERQRHFDFLLGDADKHGRCAMLPVDIYYQDLNLAIEYKERQHVAPNSHFDKTDRITVSGVHRGEQRKIYDQRRLDVLPLHGIQIIEIFYSDFVVDSKNKILRNGNDSDIIKKLLKGHCWEL